MVRSAPDASTSAVAVGLGLEVVRASVIGSSVSAASSAMTFCGKPSGVLMPVPTAVPPSGTSATRGSADCTRSMPSRIWRGVAAELLAERDRGGVHEVRAAGLHRVRPQLGLLLERDREVVERRDERRR